MSDQHLNEDRLKHEGPAVALAGPAVADTPPALAAEPRRARPVVWMVLGIILLAMNLRPALVGVSPLLDTIRSDTGLSTTMAGLLTTLPLLCFGLLSPLAPRIGHRFGPDLVLAAMMVLLVGGTALRLVHSTAALFAGSVVVGVAIAVANVLMPGVLKREFPTRISLMSGVYSMSLFGGAALAAGVTVPIQHAAHLDWRTALALWGVLAVLALVVWIPQVAHSRRPKETPAEEAITIAAEHPLRGLWNHPMAWLVACYFAAQSLIFYAAAAWLPTMLTDAGMASGTAGWMLSFASLLAIIGALATPALRARNVSPGALVLISAVLITVAFVGLLASPTSGTYLWMALLGLGQGVGLSLAVLFIVLRAPDARHAAQLSAMAQCFGYLLAAAGPFVLGAIHQGTDSWGIPLLILIILGVPTVAMGLGAARDRFASHDPAYSPREGAESAAR